VAVPSSLIPEHPVRRLLVVMAALVTLVGCRPGGGGATGASSSEAAILQFLNGARAEDLQVMSAVWGDEQSPTRDRVSRQELERRLLIIICHLRHDESRIGAAEAGEAGRTVHRVELRRGEIRAAPRFTTVRNAKDGRWYVYDLDMVAVQPICSGNPAARPPAPNPTRPPAGD
jgi:hypothetical protein